MKSAPSQRRFFDKRRGRARFGAARAFAQAKRGTVAAFSAASVGLLTIMLAAMLDYAALLSARRSAQGAMDRATISAAQAVVAAGRAQSAATAARASGAPYVSAAATARNSEGPVTVIASDNKDRRTRYDDDDDDDDDDDNANRGSAGTSPPNFDAIAQDAGAPQFEAAIATERLEATQVRFEHVDDLVLGRAELAYEPYILDALGYDAFDMTVAADARVSLTTRRAAPACFSALNGNVSGGGALNAPACGVAATGQIDSDFESSTALMCEGGACIHLDPYTTLMGNWFLNTGRELTCSDFNLTDGQISRTFWNSARFCNLVEVASGQTLHLMGGVFYFEGGLTVMGGGRVDSTGAGGGVIILKQGAPLYIQEGATFTIAPAATGAFAGLSLVGGGVVGGAHAVIVASSGSLVHLEGVIYLPGYNFSLSGQVGANETSPLAIWADDINLSLGASLSGAPTVLGGELPMLTMEEGGPAIVLAR